MAADVTQSIHRVHGCCDYKSARALNNELAAGSSFRGWCRTKDFGDGLFDHSLFKARIFDWLMPQNCKFSKNFGG